MDEKAIREFVEEKIRGKDIFLVDLSLNPGNLIQINVDKPGGISIEECVNLSREFNSAFDREKEDYDLQVSSPGLDTPFKVKEQFENNRNKEVLVTMSDGEKFKAKLLNFDEDELKLLVQRKVKEEGKKKKKLIAEEKILKHKDIKAVTAVISFK